MIALAIWASLSGKCAFGAETDANRIVVKGYRRSRVYEKGPGQATMVRAQQPTDSQTDQAIEEESSLLPQRSGSITASGTTIPMVRGQDARSTEVFLDGIKFQDNYSGLPLVEDIDLRALGYLELSRGGSDYRLPTTNQTGSLNYQLPVITQQQRRLGVAIGQPYGHAGYLLLRDQPFSRWRYQMFYKHHKTKGRYEFYDDNGTPYNTSDDRTSQRRDNHSESHQLLPIVIYHEGPHRFQYVGWLGRSENGIPGLGGREQTGAERKRDSQIHLFRYDHSFFQGELGLGLYGIYQDNVITTEDPDGQVMVTHTEQKLHNETVRQGLRLAYEKEHHGASLVYEHGNTSVRSTTADDSLKRAINSFYVGTRFGPQHGANLQLKADHHQLQDAEGADDELKTAKGTAATIGYYSIFWGSYIQVGRTDRVPSLLETFGDGGGIQGNAELENEVRRHLEWGGYSDPFSWLNLRLALFRDRVINKVVFIPIATGNSVKPLNLRETEINGGEATVSARLGRWTTRHSMTLLRTQDSSLPNSPRIPGVPDLVYTGGVQCTRGSYSTGIGARYRSKVYRDVNNTSELPGAWIYDWTGNYQSDRFGIGVAVDNLLNTQSAAVTSPETGEKGRTAVSEVNGYPLPGRTWRLEIEAAI